MTQPQYTPAQVLETARRAETDGQFDYADQAFRHILDVFPTSPEAALAREAITNRQRFTNGAGEHQHQPTPSLGDAPQAQPRPSAQAQTNGQHAPLPHMGQAPQAGRAANQPGTTAPSPAPAAATGTNLQLEPVASAGTETTSRGAGFPAPHQRSYPVARLLATLTIIFGILSVLVSLVIVASSVIDPVTTQVLTGTRLLIPNIMFSATVFGFGLVLCLIGLVAHAVFHTARNLTAYTFAEYARLRRRTP